MPSKSSSTTSGTTTGPVSSTAFTGFSMTMGDAISLAARVEGDVVGDPAPDATAGEADRTPATCAAVVAVAAAAAAAAATAGAGAGAGAGGTGVPRPLLVAATGCAEAMEGDADPAVMELRA
ncbi:hypothetical protein EON62_01980, partial [archaeon]